MANAVARRRLSADAWLTTRTFQCCTSAGSFGHLRRRCAACAGFHEGTPTRRPQTALKVGSFGSPRCAPMTTRKSSVGFAVDPIDITRLGGIETRAAAAGVFRRPYTGGHETTQGKRRSAPPRRRRLMATFTKAAIRGDTHARHVVPPASSASSQVSSQTCTNTRTASAAATILLATCCPTFARGPYEWFHQCFVNAARPPPAPPAPPPACGLVAECDTAGDVRSDLMTCARPSPSSAASTAATQEHAAPTRRCR